MKEKYQLPFHDRHPLIFFSTLAFLILMLFGLGLYQHRNDDYPFMQEPRLVRIIK
jgi:hypothetical protein